MVVVVVCVDCESFMCIYDYFFFCVCFYLCGLGVVEVIVEELVQEVLLWLWQCVVMFEVSCGSLVIWLFCIVCNLYIDCLCQECYWVVLLEGVELLEEVIDEVFFCVESYVDYVDLVWCIEKLLVIQV